VQTERQNAGDGPELRIDVLGPLQVRADDRAVPVRGAAKRAALAVLAVNANDPVPEPLLSDRLWGDEEPVHSRSILRGAVGELRRLLGAAGSGAALLADEPCYRLAVPTAGVDLLRARSLGRAGRRALDEDRPQEAAQVLRTALRLWRGPALDDVVPAGRSWPEQAELREERMQLLEDRLTADLRSGGSVELLAELDELVTREPLRERLHALRMRVLAELGRVDDALRAYDDAAARFAEEWGIDPGPLLRAEQVALRSAPLAGQVVGIPIDGDASTIMFWFSGLGAEYADPERLAGLLDGIAQRARGPVERQGGRVVPLQGPTVDAVFDGDAHATRAVRAALGVRRAVSAYLGAQDAVGAPGEGPRLRGAVAAGEVRVSAASSGLAGLVLAGSTFASCHRLLQVAAPNRVLVDRAVHRATADAFGYEPVPALPGAHEVREMREPR
jgi:DNA-binding SARP family transcriptional activator